VHTSTHMRACVRTRAVCASAVGFCMADVGIKASAARVQLSEPHGRAVVLSNEACMHAVMDNTQRAIEALQARVSECGHSALLSGMGNDGA
jgi:hypothetical protein